MRRRFLMEATTATRPRPEIVMRGYREAPKGWLGWLSTTDHKRIGIMYFAAALVFFVVGGAEALLMRLQLAQAESTLIDGQTYNGLVTMHGTTMVFLFVIPILAGFANYMVPLMIGARDMAFPRAERAVVLAARHRRDRLLHLALLRAADRRLDDVRAAVRQRLSAGRRRRRVDPADPPDGRQHRDRRDQPDRDDPQHAHARAWAGAACRCSSGPCSSSATWSSSPTRRSRRP